jgi:hypothetical protein
MEYYEKQRSLALRFGIVVAGAVFSLPSFSDLTYGSARSHAIQVILGFLVEDHLVIWCMSSTIWAALWTI